MDVHDKFEKWLKIMEKAEEDCMVSAGNPNLPVEAIVEERGSKTQKFASTIK